jgi:hypothetical protein
MVGDFSMFLWIFRLTSRRLAGRFFIFTTQQIMNHAYHSKKPVLSKKRKLEKAIIEEWGLSPIYVNLVFQFATTQHRDLFARDFNSHITNSEPWA